MSSLLYSTGTMVYNPNAKQNIGTQKLISDSLKPLHRQRGSRNLLFNEQFGNRKKRWNQWVSGQVNLTRRNLKNRRNNTRKNTNKGNNNNNNNNNDSNAQYVNISGQNWNLATGNMNYEKIPNALRPERGPKRSYLIRR
jgi:hypothetical protein